MGKAGEALLDNLRHDEQTVSLGGSVSQSVFVGYGRPNLIGSRDIHEGDRMRSRFDMRDIELVELLYVAQNLAQLSAELLFLSGRKAQSGEVRHIFHVQISCSHSFLKCSQDQQNAKAKGV